MSQALTVTVAPNVALTPNSTPLFSEKLLSVMVAIPCDEAETMLHAGGAAFRVTDVPATESVLPEPSTKKVSSRVFMPLTSTLSTTWVPPAVVNVTEFKELAVNKDSCKNEVPAFAVARKAALVMSLTSMFSTVRIPPSLSKKTPAVPEVIIESSI
jgi:hypothetical protein